MTPEQQAYLEGYMTKQAAYGPNFSPAVSQGRAAQQRRQYQIKGNNPGWLAKHLFLSDAGLKAINDPKISLNNVGRNIRMPNRTLRQNAEEMFTAGSDWVNQQWLDSQQRAAESPAAKKLADTKGDLMMGQVKRGLKKAAPWLIGGAGLMMMPQMFNAYNQHRMAGAMQQMANRPQMPRFQPPPMQRPGGYNTNVFRLHGTYPR